MLPSRFRTSLLAGCFTSVLLLWIGAAALAASDGKEAPPDAPKAPVSITIAMMGDSITYGGKWNELLGREDISNHGVIGNTTAEIIGRMPDVYREQPRICFVMAGVNDIAKGIPVEVAFDNLRSIIQGLRARQIIPVVQSTLYTRIPRYNRRIERLNAMLAAYSRKYRVDFVDLNASLAHNRLLERKYTFDGIHLRANAYEQWRRELKRTLDLHNIGPAEAQSGAPAVHAPDSGLRNPADS